MNPYQPGRGQIEEPPNRNIHDSAYGKIQHPEKLYIDDSHLYAASSRGQVALMKQLLDGDADPSWANEDGQSCLWVACWNGHGAAADVLCEAGADINAPTIGGVTPLIQATICRKAECIKVLLKHGADRTIKHGGFGGDLDALQIAREKNYKECIALLEE